MAEVGGLLAILATVALLAGGVLIGQRVAGHLRWARPVRLSPHPVPEAWAGIVRANFPLAERLGEEAFQRLLKLVQVFLDEKHFEGAGGLEITDEVRVTIAAQACFLVLWLEVGLYPALRTIIVYPSTVVPRRAGGPLAPGAADAPQAILGESWRTGVVVLSWDGVRHGAFDPRDGHNLVFHEFAHQLDQETGEADGVPVGMRLSSLKPWAEVLERRFGQLADATRRGRGTVMDPYGATNHAEFFAVATETFFERPRELRSSKPDLYALLSGFYGVDPATGLEPTGGSERVSGPG